jgi:hypothetical protein
MALASQIGTVAHTNARSVRWPPYLPEHMFSPTSNSQTSGATWRTSVWRAVDRAVAFATLDGYGLPDPHAPIDSLGAHHDREPLQAPRRPRRPAPVPRVQHCVTPLAGRPQRRKHAELERTPSPAL